MEEIKVIGLEAAAEKIKTLPVGKVIFLEFLSSSPSVEEVKATLQSLSGRTLLVSEEVVSGKNAVKVVIQA